MATSKMINAKLKRLNTVWNEKTGLPLNIQRMLLAGATDEDFHNCRYCKNYLTCSPKFEGLTPCNKYFFKED